MMADDATAKAHRQAPEKWRPLQGMPSGAEHWRLPGLADLAARWRDALARMTERGTSRTVLDIWLDERRRAFAIETGQIEGLYTLRRGVTEQLITEGLEGVVSSHTLEGVEDETIKGLLLDQEAALEMAFGMVSEGRPLSQHDIRSWHQLLTRHQGTVVGLVPVGGRLERRQVEFPAAEKGAYKRIPNNPKRPDGVLHEYCPPEQVGREMERLVALHREIAEKGYPTSVEAAWLHHRFVRTHPFRDGNGRVSRLLMAYVYMRNREPPPIIPAQNKLAYIAALEEADEGNLRAFSDYLGALATGAMRGGLLLAERALNGKTSLRHSNGGYTKDGRYFPPAET